MLHIPLSTNNQQRELCELTFHNFNSFISSIFFKRFSIILSSMEIYYSWAISFQIYRWPKVAFLWHKLIPGGTHIDVFSFSWYTYIFCNDSKIQLVWHKLATIWHWSNSHNNSKLHFLWHKFILGVIILTHWFISRTTHTNMACSIIFTFLSLFFANMSITRIQYGTMSRIHI